LQVVGGDDFMDAQTRRPGLRDSNDDEMPIKSRWRGVIGRTTGSDWRCQRRKWKRLAAP